MNVRESRRTRHLVIRLDRGDELPAALVRALDEASARSSFITGVGAFEAAELAVYDQTTRTYGRPRRIDGSCEVLSITGNAASLDGATTLRLSATLARETDRGLETFGGQIVWARAFEVELDVTVLDDVTLTRVADERTGLPVLTAKAAATNAIPAAPEPAEPPPRPAAIPLPAPAPAAPVVQAHTPPHAQPAHAAPVHTTSMPNPALPPKPMRPMDAPEVYPEVGDSVMHFAFGECTVVSSDGDRIRLQQDKDSRVREVALAMLKIDPPMTLSDGRRHFKLSRRN